MATAQTQINRQPTVRQQTVVPSVRLAARAPAWLKLAELREAMAYADEMAEDLSVLGPDELKSRVKVRSRQEIDLIPNPSFLEAGIGKAIFSETLGLQPRQSELGVAALRRSGVDLPVHLSRLCEAPLLTQDQEQKLFRRMNFLLQQAELHRGHLDPRRPSRLRLELIERLILLADWHRDRIVEANLRLVFSIVKKFVNPNNRFEDLLSDGIVSLIRAVEKFDFDRGFRFSTYATQVVRRNAYKVVVVTGQQRQATIGGLQDMEIDICDHDRSSSINEKRWYELQNRLRQMLGDLDRREKFIIRARFALGSHRKVHTLQSLANRLGVSKERVRQLERRALDKLRGMAGEVEFAASDA